MENSQKKQNMDRFQPREKQEQTDPFYTPLPLDVIWAIYARQSTPAQVKKNTQSTEMQTDELQELLVNRGVKEKKIRLYDADLGLSGTLRIDQRSDLQRLVADIESDTVKAVLVYQISRLFRDETGVQYSIFVEVCKKHSCILMTADNGMIFNFNNDLHRKMFRFLADMAAEYIPQQIGMLHAARLRKARKGLYAGLGRVSTGYIVDYNEDSKTFGKIIPYVSHKERVFSFFERFYMLQGDMSKLCRELDELPYLFPLFGPEVDKRNVSRWKKRQVPGGYNLTRKGLEMLLCNPVYIGWWIVQGNIVSRDNHEPIIDKEHEYLFWYAFNRLAPYTTDGKKNEHRQRKPRLFFHRGTDDKSGLLKDCVSSPDCDVKLHTVYGKAHYTLIPEEEFSAILRSGTSYISAATVDKSFSERFFAHLQETHDLDDYRQWVKDEIQKHNELLSSLKKQLTHIDIQQESITDEITDIRAGVKNKIRQAIEENPEIDVDSIKKVLYDEVQPMIDKHRKKFKMLEASKKEISEKLREEEENEGIATIREYNAFQTELEKLIKVWDKKPMKAKREFVNLFVTNAVLQVVSPHWVSLTIYWKHPAWNTEILYIYRRNGPQERWTDQEREVIKAYYPNTPREEILKMLPSKSWLSIVHRARILGIRRDIATTYIIPENITWADWQFMQEKGMKPTDQCTICESTSGQSTEFGTLEEMLNRLRLLYTQYGIA